jgi:tetratricopeptide (TPR) repeat protein
MVYLDKQDFDRAILDLDQAIRIKPSSAAAFSSRGEAYLGKNDPRRAVQDYDQAVRLDPNNAQLLGLRGLTYLRLQDPDHAIQDFEKVIRIDPKNAGAFNSRGDAYVLKKNYDLAMQDYNQAFRINPKDGYAIGHRGYVYQMMKDYDHAIQDYEQALRINPNDLDSMNNRGFSYKEKKQFDRALQDFDQAIRVDPNFGLAILNRGDTYMDLKDYDRAIQNFDQAVHLDPNDSDALWSRGGAYAAKKDYDRAIDDYSQVVRLNPNNADAFDDRGSAYQAKNDYDRAIQDYDQAIRIDPTQMYAFLNRADSYSAKGDNDHAIQDYDQALRLNPKSSDALGGRGYSYLATKGYANAIQDFDQALQLDPNNFSAWLGRGQANMFSGKFSVAQQDFDVARKMDPTNSYALLWSYLARANTGQNDRADLEKWAAQIKLTEWPGPVISLFLGKLTPAALLSAAADTDHEKDRGQHCEAYFYLGEQALIQGRTDEANRLFRQSVDTGVSSFIEYTGAQVELNRLQTVALAQRGSALDKPAATPQGQIGKYYALVIGIDHYRSPMPSLKTAVSDATSIANLLHDRYGFEVKLLIDGDATRGNILDAFNQYRNTLTEDDNLLVYYAGHGYSDHEAEKAYWLPSDADSIYSPNRIIADDLTTDVRVQPARHVLIISDSCYAGGLARDTGILPKYSDRQALIRKMLSRRSRTLMASGGDEPVADSGTDGHSVFAYAVLQALEKADDSEFTASDLFYNRVLTQVAGKSPQTPQYSTIRYANSEDGDFVFVRRSTGGQSLTSR